MERMPIAKSEVTDKSSLELLLSLYDCQIVSTDDKNYIVEGTKEDLEELRHYWS